MRGSEREDRERERKEEKEEEGSLTRNGGREGQVNTLFSWSFICIFIIHEKSKPKLVFDMKIKASKS